MSFAASPEAQRKDSDGNFNTADGEGESNAEDRDDSEKQLEEAWKRATQLKGQLQSLQDVNVRLHGILVDRKMKGQEMEKQVAKMEVELEALDVCEKGRYRQLEDISNQLHAVQNAQRLDGLEMSKTVMLLEEKIALMEKNNAKLVAESKQQRMTLQQQEQLLKELRDKQAALTQKLEILQAPMESTMGKSKDLNFMPSVTPGMSPMAASGLDLNQLPGMDLEQLLGPDAAAAIQDAIGDYRPGEKEDAGTGRRGKRPLRRGAEGRSGKGSPSR
mmetsp:Transcript_52805/g.115865  ORF Transcript_52805/g.115865 Transcript_52805/m.115865 type:complete len:274 (+) Transcript_52805:25-846(+)|eukprot:CAMPEP_0204399640 /NCGR_PEP_ID=MMETSP0470-20130426/3546_1 /ASSEMBLY_ACC=CAM_ASM_000385 /TAXON_ID=2969 /ORGANISM="Oxyrrhis marina" /LENGTH=273 /DNA_ID=CAMNT_0051394395 /DNA_START=17 /DNA_END=838 /DNA_ORIENTATION=+